jgi:hypothetical protein
MDPEAITDVLREVDGSVERAAEALLGNSGAEAVSQMTIITSTACTRAPRMTPHPDCRPSPHQRRRLNLLCIQALRLLVPAKAAPGRRFRPPLTTSLSSRGISRRSRTSRSRRTRPWRSGPPANCSPPPPLPFPLPLALMYARCSETSCPIHSRFELLPAAAPACAPRRRPRSAGRAQRTPPQAGRKEGRDVSD